MTKNRHINNLKAVLTPEKEAYLRNCYPNKSAASIASDIGMMKNQIYTKASRMGLSKSAIIVRSIEEFLAKNAQPSAYQLYLDAMASSQKTVTPSVEKKAVDGHKLAVRKALQRKHKERSARAAQALQSLPRKAA